MQTSYDRLKIFVEAKYFDNMSNFAKVTGIPTSTIETYKKRGSILPRKYKEEIEKAGLSWQWYEFGTGAMYSESESRKSNVGDVHEAYDMVITNISNLTVNEVLELYHKVKPIGEAFETAI